MILGEPLPRTAATVLKVAREYVDAVTGDRLAQREEFVEALTHDCYVVQVSRLPAQRRNDLEKLLSVFDQDLRAGDSRHTLELDAARMPERYAPVLRRLQLATASPELRHSMLTEDEIVGAWEQVHRSTGSSRRPSRIAERPSRSSRRPSPRGTRPSNRNGRRSKRCGAGSATVDSSGSADCLELARDRANPTAHPPNPLAAGGRMCTILPCRSPAAVPLAGARCDHARRRAPVGAAKCATVGSNGSPARCRARMDNRVWKP